MVYKFISDNFPREQQDMLLSVYFQTNRPEFFNSEFLESYKEAYSKTRSRKRDLNQIREKLLTLVDDIKQGLEVKSLTGLMIYRFNQAEKPPETNGEPKVEATERKDSSYTGTDWSQYDFSKQKTPDWL